MVEGKQWQPIQVLILGALVLLSFCGAVLAAEIATRLAGPHLTVNSLTLARMVISVLGFQGIALLWVHFFLKAHQTTWSEAFGSGRHNYLQCVVAVLVTFPFVLAIVFALGAGSEWLLRQLYQQLHWPWLEPAPQSTVELLQKEWPPHLIVVQGLLAIVVAPLGEEVLFRGILYTLLKQRGHRIAAVLFSAVLFAAIHLYPAGFLSLIFLAVVLVALYEWTGNLLAPILMHSLFNAANFALILNPKWADFFKA
jgi:membrane protease YdiL (CAAX protease family)